MEEQVVKLDIRGAAAWITLNRPTALNSLTPGIGAGIDADVARAIEGALGELRALGADLKFIRESSGGDPHALQHFVRDLLRVLIRLEQFPRPVIAAVNGLALAGGIELVLCCDIVIANQFAKLGLVHIVGMRIEAVQHPLQRAVDQTMLQRQ